MDKGLLIVSIATAVFALFAYAMARRQDRKLRNDYPSAHRDLAEPGWLARRIVGDHWPK